MTKNDLKGIVWKEGKHYVSQCLNIDVASFGTSKKEAINNLKEATDLYFEDVTSIKAIPSVIRPELVTI